MTPEERRDAMRALGYRKPVDGWSRRPYVIATCIASMVVFGAWATVFGEDNGMRLRGVVGFAVGLGVAIALLRWLLRPVAPASDDDLARELRHREWLEPREP